MCGIAGLIVRQPDDFCLDVLRRLDSVLLHRGPDDRGFLLWDGRSEPWRGRHLPNSRETRLALLHRRLSIIDLSEGGWQPMVSSDGSCDIVYNGEIYNYLELRRELEALGHVFRSQSDTEVLLAGYCHWGRAVLSRLVGMFALAICDRRARRLFLARDFFGIKPLYYVAWDGGFAFASEVKALLEHPRVSRRVAPGPVALYLSSGVVDTGAETFFADIMQLPAAHFLEMAIDAPPKRAADAVPQRYWDLPRAGAIELGEEEAARRLRDLFVESVALHLRSDVPVGSALSGGIDSSSIVMAMRYLAGKSADIHTFTYVADDPAIGEERWADMVSGAAATHSHKTRVTAGELAADIDRLVAAQDQPFGSTSIYVQHRVFALAKGAGIKVMLDGQGADEMFAGYRPYLAARVVSLLRQGSIREACMLLNKTATLRGESLSRSVLRMVAGLAPQPFVDAILRLRARSQRSAPWLNDDWFAKRGAAMPSWIHAHGRRTLREALVLTFTETSLPALLRYEDRNSMSHSIESRVPFLTPVLVQFAFSLSDQFLVASDGTSKSLFRRAMRGIVPDAILDRRDKVGFQTPELDWITALRPWVEGVLSSPILEDIPVLRPAGMRAELDAVLAGRLPFDWRIWRWLNLIRWTELFDVRYD